MVAEYPFGMREALWDSLAFDMAALLRDAIAQRGRASLVVTGGSTPGPLYGALARESVVWPQVAITLSDERWVPVTDVASNEGMLRRTLLAGPASAAAFTPLKTDAARAADAVASREAALAAMPRPFDVCLLGLGEDGHVASLFPGGALDAPGLVQPVHAPGAAGAVERISLTLRAIAAARDILLLFTGAAKLEVYRAARDGLSATPLAVLLGRTQARVSAYWHAETPA